MLRTALATLALLVVIPTANHLTSVYGLVPVAPGLTATAGTLLIGLVFVYRDVIHRAHGPAASLIVIAAGALLSFLVADPRIAVASAAAFAVSEIADLLVYVRLTRYGFAAAVIGSNVVGVLVDSCVFLPLAGFPVTVPIVLGQLVGKMWATLLVAPVVR